MATAGLRVILDDNAPDFKYSGGDWTVSTLVQWYSRTSNYPPFANDTVFGSFTLEFEGTHNKKLSHASALFHLLQEPLSRSLGIRLKISFLNRK